MKHRGGGAWFLAVAGLLMLVGCGSGGDGGLAIEDVWARPVMAGGGGMGAAGTGVAATGAVFMRIVNDGGQSDRLLGGSTDVAEAVEVHETVVEGDVMRMQMLPDGLEIPPGGQVLLEPGSYHIMLVGMRRDLAAGDTFELELRFENAGSRAVRVEVRELGK